MKSTYFNKVENKYVFNFSRIFWHLFIALAAVAIVVSIAILLWSIIPPAEKKINKAPYPEKQAYPEPVTVSVNELNSEFNTRARTTTQSSQPRVQLPATTSEALSDTAGKAAYYTAYKKLEQLIPRSSNSWEGSGYWNYPYGERYWTAYQNEDYRQWIQTELGIDEQLNTTFKEVSANNYTQRSELLQSYNKLLNYMPAAQRKQVLVYLMYKTNESLSHTVGINLSTAAVAEKIKISNDLSEIGQLIDFGMKNTDDGSECIEYLGRILIHFEASQHDKIIDAYITSHERYFSSDFSRQKEATDLFIPLLDKLKGENQAKSMYRFYEVYQYKNASRQEAIARIDKAWNEKVEEIEYNYNEAIHTANLETEVKKARKSTLRFQSLIVTGSSIVLIVLIANLLVFLSIQRSVRRMEEKMTTPDNLN